MLCAVYKSSRKADTYLYVRQRDDFSDVPEPLMATFGQPQLVMVINLGGRTQLGQATLEKVEQALSEQGYYLQLPPPPENLLDEHKKQRGIK